MQCFATWSVHVCFLPQTPEGHGLVVVYVEITVVQLLRVVFCSAFNLKVNYGLVYVFYAQRVFIYD